MSLKIVAVCNCPIGVAHTYMAAEALTKACAEKGFEIKVETQGAFGTDCELTEEDIQKADYVILALGTTLSPEALKKYEGKCVVHRGINEVLKDPHKVLEELGKSRHTPRQSSQLFNHLMKGMSYMIPLAIAAGLLVAMASIGLTHTPKMGTYSYLLYIAGLVGLELMLPVLGAGIAYSIGDKAALAPALIGGYLLTQYELLGTQYSSGLLGAVFVGFLAGYLVKSLSRIRLSDQLAPMMKFIGIPLLSTVSVITCIYYVIAPSVSIVMGQLTAWLGQLSGNNTVLVCIVLGIMIVSDMGGPINKTAYLFALGMVSEGYRLYFGIVALVVVLPAAGVGLAAMLRPSLFNKEEQENGKSAFVLGLMGLSEPAILYAVNDPIPIMGAQIIAAILTSILGCVYGIERIAPGINIIDPLFGNVTPMVAFYCILGIGISVNCILIILFKKIRGWQHV